MRRWIGASAAVSALAVVLALTGAGEVIARAIFRFLEFYTGVFALVALSLTVMGGLVATDRVVLLVRHRVLLQSVHRLTGLLAVTCLAIHITLKVAEGHAGLVDVFVPFLSANRRLLIGFGTLAAYLMGALAWTGVARARFASGKRPWVWRMLHLSAYPTWVIAIVHGLGSGRHAATWVTVSYVACVVGVGLGLLLRLSITRNRRAPAAHAGPRSVRTVLAAVARPTSTIALTRTGVTPAVPGGDAVPSRPPGLPVALSDDEFWRRMKGDGVR
ncbi:MAG TPA: hypothetical protein VH561_11375 [Micromonosporaceae bacterium]